MPYTTHDTYTPEIDPFAITKHADQVKFHLLSAAEEIELAKRVEASMIAGHVLEQLRGSPDYADIPDSQRIAVHFTHTGFRPPSRHGKAAPAAIIDTCFTRPDVATNNANVGIEISPEELVLLALDGVAARNTLILHNLRLVTWVLQRYFPPLPTHDRADRIQAGNLGLLRAAEMFDYKKGYRFSTYAKHWIRFRMSKSNKTLQDEPLPRAAQELQKNIERLTIDLQRTPTREEIVSASTLPRHEVDMLLQRIAQHFPLSLDQPAFSSANSDTTTLGEYITASKHDDINGMVSQLAIESALDSLPERSSTILRKRFGLGSHTEQTVEEIAQQFNHPPHLIRLWEREALRQMAQLAVSGGLL